MSLNRTQIVDQLYRCGDIFTKEGDFLAGLDKEIGDADHGPNMHRDSSKVVEKLSSIADKDIGFTLGNTGMALFSNIGGTGGSLFGTPFIHAAQVTRAHQSSTLGELYLVTREDAGRVANRGKAESGDKTMCDVWLSVADSPRQSNEQCLPIAAALDAACEVAERAAYATITMQARKGRASYLGECGIEHQDPGTTSVLFMVQTLAAAAKE